MNKIHCIQCNKYEKLKNPKVSYIFDKILVFSSIFDKYGSNDEKRLIEEESIEILKIFGFNQ